MNLSNSDNRMKDKICLVTGATSGIGKVTATALVAIGAEVVILGRNLQKIQETLRHIRDETGNGTTQFIQADFSDFQQVREAAASFKERYSRLDVLINNAGAYFNLRRLTPNGLERTFQVNHLSPFLLTNLLLETILTSTPARIINVSSGSHWQADMDFDDLGFQRGYFGMKAYARSKLANIMFTYELAQRLQGRDVMVNAVHPGHVATDIWSTNFSIIGPALKWLMSLIALTPEQGAKTPIYLASSPEVDGVTGKYFVHLEAKPSSPFSYDQETARRLWEVSEELTGLNQGSNHDGL
jgi:retinol dehydrogenase-14